MSDFTLDEVVRLAGLPKARVRALVQARVLEPRGGPDDWRFSFRDLALCRSARALQSSVSPDRLTGVLSEVKARLPQEQPLSGVGFSAEGRRVVARDGEVCWEVDSGQVRFDFGEPAQAAPTAIVNLGSFDAELTQASSEAPPTMTSIEWFDLGLELEAKHPEQARDAYRRALELDPLDREARLNAARLLRHAGLVEAAEAHYRLAADLHPDDARSVYHLGLLLEGQARWWDAVAAYESARQRSPQSADIYRRLAGLYERLGDSTQALRALKTYRALTEGP